MGRRVGNCSRKLCLSVLSRISEFPPNFPEFPEFRPEVGFVAASGSDVILKVGAELAEVVPEARGFGPLGGTDG